MLHPDVPSEEEDEGEPFRSFNLRAGQFFNKLKAGRIELEGSVKDAAGNHLCAVK